MLKWTHLAQYSRIYYFLSPTRQNTGHLTFPFLPVESRGGKTSDIEPGID
jgi:hypothetical protein